MLEKLLGAGIAGVIMTLIIAPIARRHPRKAMHYTSDPTDAPVGRQLTPSIVYIGSNDNYYHSRANCPSLNGFGKSCQKLLRSDAELSGKLPCPDCMFDNGKV